MRARPLNLILPTELLCHVFSRRMVLKDRSQQQEPTGSESSSDSTVSVFGNNLVVDNARYRAPDKAVICWLSLDLHSALHLWTSWSNVDTEGRSCSYCTFIYSIWSLVIAWLLASMRYHDKSAGINCCGKWSACVQRMAETGLACSTLPHLSGCHQQLARCVCRPAVRGFCGAISSAFATVTARWYSMLYLSPFRNWSITITSAWASSRAFNKLQSVAWRAVLSGLEYPRINWTTMQHMTHWKAS